MGFIPESHTKKRGLGTPRDGGVKVSIQGRKKIEDSGDVSGFARSHGGGKAQEANASLFSVSTSPKATGSAIPPWASPYFRDMTHISFKPISIKQLN